MAASVRRHRLSRGSGQNDGCRSVRTPAGRDVADSYRHESEDLLGPDSDRHDAADRAGRHPRGPAGRGLLWIPWISEEV